MVASVPSSGRQYSSFLVHTPGVQTDPAFGIQHEGTGNAVWIRGTNTSNQETGIDYEYEGLGVGLSYNYTNDLSTRIGFQYEYSGRGTGLNFNYLNSLGTGEALKLLYGGLDRALSIDYTNQNSTAPALDMYYRGMGHALSIMGTNSTSTADLFFLDATHGGRVFGLNQTGTGRAFEAQINNPSSNEVTGLFYNTGLGTNFYAYTANANNTNPAGWFYNTGSQGIGIYGVGATAGRFDGNVDVNGTLSKSSGTFKIDHPLDPANKFLYHSFVESPDMMNMYNGNVQLNGSGEAWVELPEWFGSLNNHFRYQLTCVGGYAPVYIADKIQNNRFRIAGGTSGLEVSWQVTGVRKDPYAEQNRIRVEVQKESGERGKYLHPEAYGLPASMGIRSVWDEKAAKLAGSLEKEDD
jgi:hypothetical protein